MSIDRIKLAYECADALWNIADTEEDTAKAQVMSVAVGLLRSIQSDSDHGLVVPQDYAEQIQTLFAETAILLTHSDPERQALAKRRVYDTLFAQCGGVGGENR